MSLHERHDGNGALKVVVSDERVIDHDARDVEVLRVVGVEHTTGNVRHVHSRVRLAGEIHLVPSQVEGIDKVLPERHELVGNVDLVIGRGSSLGEARTDRLVDIDDVGQAIPSIGVLDWQKCASLPKEWPILLQETLERRASGLEVVVVKRGIS